MRQRAERQRHRLRAVARQQVGEHAVAEHELALHAGRVERVERDVVLRVVAELEAVLDQPAQRGRGRAAVPFERVPGHEERRRRGEVGMQRREGLEHADARVRVEGAVSPEADLVVVRVVEGEHDRRLALRHVELPGDEVGRAHGVEAVPPEPHQLDRSWAAVMSNSLPFGRIWWCISTGTRPSSSGFMLFTTSAVLCRFGKEAVRASVGSAPAV